MSLKCLAFNSGTTSLAFETPNVLNRLSNKDVQSVYQDRDGYIWISTRNGLFQFDGYSIVTYRSNYTRPDLLTNNNVLCVAEDTKQNLWIGTYSGLNVLDKRTGQIRKIDHSGLNGNGIPQILVTRNGRVFFATDWGLYEYVAEADSVRVYNRENTDEVFPQTTIKTLCEDHRGDIWIGTWDRGLYRYETSSGKFFKYPKMNAQNSAHVVFQDSRKNIWVGSWNGGLALLKDAWQPEKTSWVTYKYDSKNPNGLLNNIIYAISEDANTGALWIGTPKGLSILAAADDYTGEETFSNYYPNTEENSIVSDEVTSLLNDRQGLMWVGMIGGGVAKVKTRKADFVWDKLQESNRQLKTTSVRTLLIDDENLLWMGIGSYGLGVKDGNTGKFTYYTQMPEFDNTPSFTTVTSIMQCSSNGHIWISSYDNGVYEVDKHAPMAQRVRHYYPYEAPWLAGQCVYHVYEDSKHNLWFSTRTGVSMRTFDDKAVRFDTLMIGDTSMRSILTVGATEGNDGDIWVASGTHGVLRLRPSANSAVGYVLTHYATVNHGLNADYVDCVYRDTHGRIWAGTGVSGLNLYDPQTDAFLPVHSRWNLPGDAVASIKEDKSGHLWLGTNAGLVNLSVSDDLKEVTFRLYTTVDGLQDNIFLRGAASVSADGRMFFGGHRGYNSFYPERLDSQDTFFPVVVTDIKVFNQSWSSLPDKERTAISALSPGFSDEIRLDYRHNNFTIEYSALEYINPERNQYAYKLEGFDEEWQYTDASKRFAYYNNLHTGTYTFHLKASNANGTWNNHVYQMKVVILPPPWKTWWAYTLYIVFIAAASYFFYRQVRNRMRLRNALQLREMEKARVEEVNHAKLQFFTNITHELLTPLTIISASVDELKRTAPDYKDQYRVMTDNINRLIRLLQQILEFRKAETGNLKLRVSQADLSQFVRRSLDSFRPLMKRKDMRFSVSCHPDPLFAYFDTDKLDKILYNLLSNASKYNRPGGMIAVELTGDENGRALLMVKDDGEGISKDAQKDLFKRFYEGDYRKFKTIGTGIGLSLVRDLVALHHGTIRVESEKGQGTAFIVSFPVLRSAYSEEEIDESLSIVPAQDAALAETATPMTTVTDEALPADDAEMEDESDVADESADAAPASRYTLLLVEDNEDLLQLMVKLLSTDYRVLTATNGREALAQVEKEEINLIVSDVMMPEMDGIELCRYLKGNFDTSHIPVLLLTAKNKEEDRVEAYESGADSFLSKPFNLSVLHARIENLLRSRRQVMKEFKKQIVFESKQLDYTSIDEDFLKRAVDCVNRHLSDGEFDLAQFLEEMHTTKSTCFRKLKSLTGLTYVSFIRNIRMKAACRMMEEKKHVRISELAYAVGYNDPRYFSAIFKKEFGMQPSEYMERCTQGSGTLEED
ncbi:MAG: two-component regulator propeller domain-containing protein [Bacteroides sp.]|nr:two-component regulator propeller domain-containing protein [Bacteroides sp.]